MTYSDLTSREQRFLNLLHETEAADPPAFIGAVAILCHHSKQDSVPFEFAYSRGTFKRAIKRLRVLQQDKPQYAGIYEEAIAFIRRNWLHRKEAHT